MHAFLPPPRRRPCRLNWAEAAGALAAGAAICLGAKYIFAAILIIFMAAGQ